MRILWNKKVEIFKAAELSMSSEFINKLDKKFDTIIGENGQVIGGKNKEYL